MTKGETGRPACAACKYQRRKCSQQCVLASYFPADQPKKFQNAHRLFGVRNIVKTLEQLDGDDQKADAMKSIIFESDMREKFPIYGCVECILYLRQQLQLALQEREYVYTQLAIYRQQHLRLSSSENNSVGNGIMTAPFFSSDSESSQGIIYPDFDKHNSLAYPTSNHVFRLGSQEQQEVSRDIESLTLFNSSLVDDK
ncbi:PREDICTED: LOB domain-containing protein 27-like [Nicotiana attenuata]|uniref:Lob domain-containing protein 27 n=1 Tax=Nicotiana attenuata TaxID=49451 RepID=A0A314KNP3_NICAT|nr:PREDICTED: LOB domain-containing protein 27-like [Nicotiana attenuata]OIT30354.1 lob domain-containing protein 27 [Nicotiana attenuata]